MPDTLTPAEREAIARYTGPIRVIPRGVSGIPPEQCGKGQDYKNQNRTLWAEAAARGRARAAYLRRIGETNDHTQGA